MIVQLRVNLATHLLLARRSRLLLALAVVLAVIFALSLLPTVFFAESTAGGRFATLRSLHTLGAELLFTFSAVLGLALVALPLRDRSVKMIVTRPCPLHVWLGSAYLASGAIVLAAYLTLMLAAGAASLGFGIPLQAGLLFRSLSEALAALTIMSFVLPLGLAFHPLLGLGLAVILRHDLWSMLAEAATRAGSGWATAAGWIARIVDLLLPRYATGDAQALSGIAASWRVEPAQWWLLTSHLAYVALWVALSFAASLAALRRKSLA